jgi:hypothetical protein
MSETYHRPSLIAIGEQMIEKHEESLHVIDASGTSPTSMTGLNHNHADVDVEIEPDVKGNHVSVHLCACSLILNCFTRDTSSKSD